MDLKGRVRTGCKESLRICRRGIGGQHLWARGYFCATVGAVNEEQIKRYIENQSEDEGEFKVGDEERTKKPTLE